LSGVTEKDGVFSPWKGQQPQKLPPRFFSGTYSEIYLDDISLGANLLFKIIKHTTHNYCSCHLEYHLIYYIQYLTKNPLFNGR